MHTGRGPRRGTAVRWKFSLHIKYLAKNYAEMVPPKNSMKKIHTEKFVRIAPFRLQYFSRTDNTAIMTDSPLPPRMCPKCKVVDMNKWGLNHNCNPRPATKVEEPVAKPKPKAASKKQSVARGSKSSAGRPRKGTEDQTIAATKPWLAEGISERTWWYRRRKP